MEFITEFLTFFFCRQIQIIKKDKKITPGNRQRTVKAYRGRGDKPVDILDHRIKWKSIQNVFSRCSVVRTRHALAALRTAASADVS